MCELVLRPGFLGIDDYSTRHSRAMGNFLGSVTTLIIQIGNTFDYVVSFYVDFTSHLFFGGNNEFR